MRETREEGASLSRSFSSTRRKRRQLNISREPRTGRRVDGRTEGREGDRGGGEAQVVIYEVSKTLYTPTRQRAGLSPRNPVLALTHRYLSHDHFRVCPCKRRYSAHTRAPSTGLLYPPRRCLYHLQRPSCRRRGRVPRRYSLSGTTVRRMIHVISHPGYRRPPVRMKRRRNHCLAPGPPPPPVSWRQMVQ